MHSTKEHKSKKKSGFVATAAVPVSKPPLPPVMESAMQCVPIAPPVSYELGSLQRVSGFDTPSVPFAQAPSDDDDASVGSVDNGLLAILSRSYPKV